MNTNRCSKYLIAACLISLSTSAWAQITRPEQELGTGFEPVVNADRVTNDPLLRQRVQFLWMTNDTFQINRTITHNLGQSWLAAIPFPDTKTRIDPFTACNVGGTADPRHMYFGWYSETGIPSGTHFLRSLRGDEFDHEVVAQSDGTDRPWLVANSASLYLSYNDNNSGTPRVKRTAIPPAEQEVTWPGSPVPVGTPAGGTSFVPHFPVATYLGSIGAERTFVLVRQHRTNGIGLFDNLPVRTAVGGCVSGIMGRG
jgi:hypothetical protein